MNNETILAHTQQVSKAQLYLIGQKCSITSRFMLIMAIAEHIRPRKCYFTHIHTHTLSFQLNWLSFLNYSNMCSLP